MYSLEVLFEQARSMPSSIYTKTKKCESVMSTGAKINKFSDSGKDDNTDAFDSGTKYIAMDVQNADVFVTFDTSAPTTSNGHKLFAGRSYTFSTDAAVKAKFIQAGGTSAIIHASQFTN